jgi:Asp-tRNA(Asn)/Glu-tRNA(Gln) amidotransferase B subunit
LFSPDTKRARIKIVHQLADKAAKHIQRRKEVYGKFKRMMDDARKVYPWVTNDHQVKCRLKRLRKKRILVDITNILMLMMILPTQALNTKVVVQKAPRSQ